MPKTNFTKVEELLDQNLLKMTVNLLLDETATEKEKNPHLTEANRQLLLSIKQDLHKIPKKNKAIYEKIGIKKKELDHWMEHPDALTPQEWETLNQMHQKIQAFKDELKKKLPAIDNEGLVEAERKKHINKRFNISDKWLPLT